MNFSLDKSALLVIDVQRYFFEMVAPVKPQIITLIESFRKANLPIVFTRHAHKKGEPAGQMGRWWHEELPIDGDEESLLIKDITPLKSEMVLVKTKYSAFENTNLAETLREKGVGTVVICGVMTNVCVETTARHAFMKDFQPVVIEDACAANTKEHHKAAILNLSYGFAYVEKTDFILSKLPHENI